MDKEISQMSSKGSNSKICFVGMISTTQPGPWSQPGILGGIKVDIRYHMFIILGLWSG